MTVKSWAPIELYPKPYQSSVLWICFLALKGRWELTRMSAGRKLDSEDIVKSAVQYKIVKSQKWMLKSSSDIFFGCMRTSAELCDRLLLFTSSSFSASEKP